MKKIVKKDISKKNTSEKNKVSGNIDIKKNKKIKSKVKKEKKKDKIVKKKRQIRIPILSTMGLSDEKDYFMENLSMLLSSGMDILSSLRAIKTGIRSKILKEMIDDIEKDVDAGLTVSRAVEKVKLFPDHIISLIKIGEETGRLPDNIKVIVVQQQKERSFKSKVRSAMMYPSLVLGLTAVVGIAIAWFILPRLSSVFGSLRLELPAITRALIAFGNFIGQYGIIVVPIFVLLFICIIYFVFIFPLTKFIGQFLLFKIPGIGKLIQEVQMAQMGYILGTLLNAGLPIVSAIGSLAEATTFYRYKKFFLFLQKSIEDGNSFQETFKIYPKSGNIITIPIQQMIASAEKSGRLPETLLKIGEIFEEKTEATTKNLAVILEPILLIIIWLGVISVALAVILPIYSLVGGLNKSSTASPAPTPPSIELNVNQPTSTPVIIDATNNRVAKKIKVINNSSGYLDVRSTPSSDGIFIVNIYPDEIYEYVNEENRWYEIILPSGETGWVPGAYVVLFEE